MNSPIQRLDWRAIFTSLFLPLLYWTGTVVMITLFGYPGVACMTPAAWLLALPVGLRVARESQSAGTRLAGEAAVAGGLLGFWQGLLFAVAMTASPLVPNMAYTEDLPSPLLVGAIASLIGIPITAVMSAFFAWVVRKRAQAGELF